MGSVDDGTVLGRATLILELVESAGCISQAELARQSALPKPTVRRLAGDLTRRGLLTRCLDGYELGPRLASLGAAALGQHPFRAVAAPHLQDLLARTGQVAFVMDVEADLTMVTLHVAYGHQRAPAVNSTLGGWPPVEPVEPELLFKAAGRIAYAEHPDRVEALIASGVRRPTRYAAPTRRALLAAIDATLDAGMAVEREEHTLGWSCIAAGVRDRSDAVVGVVGVIGHGGTWDPERVRRPLTHVADALAAATPSAQADAQRALTRPRVGE
ncbi:IclR family transcriptional regulator [Cellulomonas rhizosphaerae]|uniref:Winged helix-turn-helix transcriptional regulator n=1 Tax=Cellulomonas rhizosphaerae TaxID=2293719 RepID=A0A413RP08_9CELL|nr:IclR family transcriptional regulator C-terminal domain-containing protein [Cellulomonas rhizosphaerae]RHA43640.1 winged helix-turn-helix transcriptional regulator [Cellulomonas rhizosphaerae]